MTSTSSKSGRTPSVVHHLAVTVLVFGLYFPRYRRRDMVVAILGLNVGVMAVATARDPTCSAR